MNTIKELRQKGQELKSRISKFGAPMGNKNAAGPHTGRSGITNLPHGKSPGQLGIEAARRDQIPKAAAPYAKHYKGFDPGVTTPSGKLGAHVFEFPTHAAKNSFLSKVGGAPHPLGGKRVILT